jgi:hypothetical protein
VLCYLHVIILFVGSSLAINEIMVQSYQGAILFFPFAKTYPIAHSCKFLFFFILFYFLMVLIFRNLKSTDAFMFENLRAVGAFLISATFQNNLVGSSLCTF